MGGVARWSKSHVLFLAAFCFCGLTAFAQTTDWNVAVLDTILKTVKPGQDRVQVGDMVFTVSFAKSWRRQLAGGPGPLLAFDGSIPTWTGGNVYYTFSNSVSATHQKAFLDGMNEWATFASLNIIPRTTQSNYVTIVDGGTLQEGGDSAVGMIGGQQFIHIGSTSWNRPTVCHEFGHTLGLIHEHQRSDRDSFVTIFTNNIIPGLEGNFVKLTNSLNETPYDFLSVMHYSRNNLSITNIADTIEPLPAFIQYINIMGQQFDPVLSASDRAGMALRYGAPATPVTNIVINTKDSGSGSLRAAMYYAFDHPGTTVTFNIPTSDPGFSNSVFTIQPTDRFPSMVNAMTIDGTTEPTNSNPNGPAILLNGSLTTLPDVFANGLRMIGTNCAAKRLVINGFNGSGIDIEGSNAVGNVVAGCYIGTDPSGMFAVNNGLNCIFLGSGAHSNTIGGTTAAARNVISGSAFQGMFVRDPGTSGNSILGNYIGLNAAGTGAIPNGFAGIEINFGAQNNTVGGTATGARNVISGNTDQGIAIFGTNTSGQVVQGNYIGVDATGTNAIPNNFAGIEINFTASSNLIGGTVSAARNVLSGNNSQGIAVFGTNTVGNVIQGNYIGLDATGSTAVSNNFAGIEINLGAQSNIVGGTVGGAGNVISGNNSQGIFIGGAGTDGNFVQGNLIGTDPLGITAIGNQFSGVELGGGRSNQVGGTSATARNLISGNAKQGVLIDSISTDGNRIQGNYIGVNITGMSALGNGTNGIELCCGARSNLIGGTVSSAANVISGNGAYGVQLGGVGTDGTFIQGNLIGVAVNGSSPLGNIFGGILIYGGAQLTQIGGTLPGSRNIISGNVNYGVLLVDPGTHANLVQGNYVGLDASGVVAVPNTFAGVAIFGAATSNTVGGGVGARNVISGNTTYGVFISDTNTEGNIVQGNTIGLDPTSLIAIGNGSAGVEIQNAASSNLIGGVTLGAANLIASNGSAGVLFFDAATTNNSILGNSIYGNTAVGINLNGVANRMQAAPALSLALLGTNTVVSGSLTSASNTTFRVEFFANPTGLGSQGKTFLGATNVTTGSGGTANFSAGVASTVPVGQLVTATATDPAGNTSPFSSSVTVTTTDSVGDEIPNAWRAAFFGGAGNTTNNQSCASCNPDGDGFTNYQEFRAGTDPTKSSSALRISVVQVVGSNSVMLGFTSVNGKVYRVETKDDLTSSSWTLLADQISGTGGTIQITDPGAATLTKRFYHVLVLP